MQNDCEMHIIDRQGARSVKTTSFISTLTLCIFSITKIWNLHITNRNDNFDKLWNIFKHDFLTPPTFRPLVLIRSKRLHNKYTLKILSVSLQIKFYNSQIFLNSPCGTFPNNWILWSYLTIVWLTNHSTFTIKPIIQYILCSEGSFSYWFPCKFWIKGA